jgi:hypothetical protein
MRPGHSGWMLWLIPDGNEGWAMSTKGRIYATTTLDPGAKVVMGLNVAHGRSVVPFRSVWASPIVCGLKNSQ